jgi:hypothetical protein
MDQGHAHALFSAADRSTLAGRERAIGIVFMRYVNQPLEVETETTRFRLKLERLTRRWEPGENPYVQYQFEVLEESPLEEPPPKKEAERRVIVKGSDTSAKASSKTRRRTRHTPPTRKPR